MKNNPMNRLLIPTLSAVLTLILLCTALPAVAQQADGSDSIPRHRKAWEIGVGIHGLQLTRFNVTGFSPGSNGGYRIDTSLPGSQKARISSSIPSSAPRLTSTCSGFTPAYCA